MRNIRQAVLLLSVFLLIGGAVFAQDPGIPDTVRLAHVSTNAGQRVGVPVYVINDEDLGGYSLGFIWNTGDISVDSVSYIGTRLSPDVNKMKTINNPAHRILVGMADFTAGNPLTPGNGLVFTMWFTVGVGVPDQFVDIDTSFFPPAGKVVLSATSGASITPQYSMGQIKIGNPQPPPVIVLSGSLFTFDALVGGGNPTSQVQQIINGGGQSLNWTATKNTSWLNLSPMFGTAPSVMVVAVNTTGLGGGVYVDTVTISATGATNTPQKFAVQLTMTIPPPTIKLTPTQFSFAAQQNSTNPPGQNLNIANIGQGVLNWTATKNASWLTLSGYSGTAPSNVTVTVDNTGLVAGVYVDSIAIADPTATNSPQYARVTFEVFSEFPVILPDPDSIFAVGSDTQNPYPHILLIRNNGSGVMNWHVSKKSSWMSFDKDSGSATQAEPGVLTLNFDRTQVYFGQSRDTIVITSTNAINSPQRVPVIFWKAEVPQQLNVSTHALTFWEFECGSYPGVQPQTFNVTPSTISPPLAWHSTHNASWLTVTPTSAPNAAAVTVRVSVAGLTPGVYTDTITITSAVVINPPEKVVVTFNVNPTPGIKNLALTRDSLLFIYKYTQVGSAEQDVTVYNFAGGCIDWQATANVPWVEAVPNSGTTTETIVVRANSVGVPLGRHEGKLIFTSSVAANSPKNLPVVLWIYTFGDANGDGYIDISDVVYIMQYIFYDGPAPVPVFWSGDVDCSRTIDISDCVYLINYIFDQGAPPCLW